MIGELHNRCCDGDEGAVMLQRLASKDQLGATQNSEDRPRERTQQQRSIATPRWLKRD